ncbi:hypothetical protein EYF80_056673 [Liparis tanakae]|uniref:Uncharacterized protein n=1 Tax=Liparis tanakae TaxID=230148 RepID=A0A4Z2EY85_9TELE|nr:hypothetical protein EYF80_056673 [Liparis tanakae]
MNGCAVEVRVRFYDVSAAVRSRSVGLCPGETRHPPLKLVFWRSQALAPFSQSASRGMGASSIPSQSAVLCLGARLNV